nr:hypothetical protein [Tanacetum cinerariifolium]
WLRKDYQEEGKEVTWDIFYEELSSRLGPTNCKEFDEALSKVQKTGPSREYQKEFERAMASNKDRIENLEAALGLLQDGIAEMKICFVDKFQHLEDIVSKLFDTVLFGKGGDNYKQVGRAMASNIDRIENWEAALGQLQDCIAEIQASSARPTKNTTMKRLTWDEMQKKRAQGGDNYKQARRLMFYSKLTLLEFLTYCGDEDPTTWFLKVIQFFKNKGTLFGPTDCEDFDEFLLKVQQTSPFPEYQKEFERLGNRVRGWTLKALVGTFMGGLKPKITDGIRMFKTDKSKDATSLARMRDEQLNRFEGHKCKGPQLLVMESALDEDDCESFVYYVVLEVKVLLKRMVMMSQNKVMKSMACLHAYRGDEDPTEWFTKVNQLFENQGTPVTQKVSLASYQLQELWSRFGPTDCEDFDEAFSKELVGTFMGGLKPKIADDIRMFKPTNLKDATSLARIRDEQLNLLSPITQASSARPTKNTTMKWLTWDEMQKKRAQSLYFNCDEKFSVGHKCKGPQLLVMESTLEEGDCVSLVYQHEP